MLFFIHVPKCGGTSLRNALAACLGPRLVPIYKNRPEWSLAAALKSNVPSDAVLFGHFSFGLHEQFCAPPRYATVLRRPLDRVLSWHRMRRVREISPPANRMVAMLAGCSERGTSDPDMLQIAKTNLQTFEFVSFLERLPKDLSHLEHIVGAQIPLRHDNRSQPDHGADQALSPEIERNNQLDQALYEFAMSAIKPRTGGASPGR